MGKIFPPIGSVAERLHLPMMTSQKFLPMMTSQRLLLTMTSKTPPYNDVTKTPPFHDVTKPPPPFHDVTNPPPPFNDVTDTITQGNRNSSISMNIHLAQPGFGRKSKIIRFKVIFCE